MKKILLLFLAVIPVLVSAKTQLIKVADQAQFDALDVNLKTAIRQGNTEITVSISDGVYYYGEQHINLSSLSSPKVKVSIEGQNAILVAKDLQKERSWEDGTFDTKTLKDVDRWSDLQQCVSDVSVVDEEQKLCRIRIKGSQRRLSESQCKGQFIQITQWYDSQIYPIVRREKRYIYFTATDLKYHKSYKCWNVNLDQYYGHVTPRYRTISSPQTYSSTVKYCQASTFINLWHSELAGLTLRGLSFCGNNGTQPLIATDMFVSDQFLIDQCSFSGIRGLVIKIWHTNHARVQQCTFEDCHANGVESFNGASDTQVLNCTFRRHGAGMRQNFGIVCRGENFLIKGNTFRNFTCSAIGVGVWYGNKPKYPITGSVTENDIAYEPSYYNQYKKHTLMDGGAIYTWTLCDRVEISNNRIDRYRGMRDYRGIFCDDGTKNVTLKGNTITNIGDNGYCIDLRWVDHVTEKVADHNTGNRMSDNKVDGRVRFETSKP